MLLLPRLRLALARRPWLYWLFVMGCAAIVWSTVSSTQSRLDEQRHLWGQTRRVWIAVGDTALGAPIHSVARDYPIAMVPASALDDDPAGAIATASIADGEVLVASDVATTESVAPSGWVVFALGFDGSPALRPGNDVAIFGSGQRLCDGVVVTVGDDTVGVGLPPECAASVSAQVASDSIVLAQVLRTG